MLRSSIITQWLRYSATILATCCACGDVDVVAIRMGGSSTSGAGASSAGGNSEPGGAGGRAVGGGGSSAGAGGTVQPSLGCSKLAFLFETYAAKEDGSRATCSGKVGTGGSKFIFTLPLPVRYDFTVDSDLSIGQTGTFNATVRGSSIDLFAGPWLSKSGQCTLTVSQNESHDVSAGIVATIICVPAAIDATDVNNQISLTIEKWEFTVELPLE